MRLCVVTPEPGVQRRVQGCGGGQETVAPHDFHLGRTIVTAPKGHRAGPWAKAILILIIVVSVVAIWAFARSIETAAPADNAPLIPAADVDGKQ